LKKESKMAHEDTKTLYPTLHTGDTVALLTSYGNYLRLVDRDPAGNHLDVSSNLLDDRCRFVVTKLPNDQIALQAVNGKYLYIGSRNGIEIINLVTKSGEINWVGKFTIIADPGGWIRLKCFNDKFLGLDNTALNKGAVRPSKANPDEALSFTVVPLCVNQLLKPAFPTDAQVVLKTDANKYLSRNVNPRVHPMDQIIAEKDQFDATCVFTLTNLPGGKIALQADNRSYVSQKSYVNQEGTTVQALFANEARLKPECHLRLISSVGDGWAALQADNGKYLSFVRDTGRIDVTKDVLDSSCLFQMESSSAQPNGRTIALQASNGNYVMFVTRGQGNGLEATAPPPLMSQFTFTPLPNNQIALALDGKYCSLTTQQLGQNQRYLIEPRRDVIDQSCKFTVKPLSDGRIALQASNGNYLQLIRDRLQGVHTIEAFLNMPDSGIEAVEDAKFGVVPLSINQQAALAFHREEVIALQADNGKFLSSGGNFDRDVVGEDSKFTVVTLPNGRVALFSIEKRQGIEGRPYGSFWYLGLTKDNDHNSVRADKNSLDEACSFTMVSNTWASLTSAPFPDNKIALRADNGKFLSRVTRDQQDKAEANKETIEAAALFNVVWLAPTPKPQLTPEMQRPALLHNLASQRNHVFWYDANGALRQSSWDGQRWQAQTVLEGQPAACSGPIVEQNVTGLLWNDSLGHVCVSSTDADKWKSSEMLPVPSLSSAFAPVVLSNERDEMEVFFCDADCALWHGTWNQGRWQVERIERGPLFSQPTAIYYWPNRRQHVFWCNEKGLFRRTYWDGARWQTEALDTLQGAGGRILSPVPLYNQNDLSINLFWFDSDSRLRTAWFNPLANSPQWNSEVVYQPSFLTRPFVKTQPSDRPGYVAEDRKKYAGDVEPTDLTPRCLPAPLYNPLDRSLHVFWLAERATLKHTWRSASGWQAPETVLDWVMRVTENLGEEVSPPAAFFNPLSNRLEVFWLGRFVSFPSSDYKVFFKWKNGAGWQTGRAS
jgi:hypothetical protein